MRKYDSFTRTNQIVEFEFETLGLSEKDNINCLKYTLRAKESHIQRIKRNQEDATIYV